MFTGGVLPFGLVRGAGSEPGAAVAEVGIGHIDLGGQNAPLVCGIALAGALYDQAAVTAGGHGLGGHRRAPDSRNAQPSRCPRR
jgi:hypothetical protein